MPRSSPGPGRHGAAGPRVLILGLGVQGRKRMAFCGPELAGTVDPHVGDAGHRSVTDVPLDSYDAVLACIPDEAKVPVLEYLLGNGKHVLVEKPLLEQAPGDLKRLGELAARKGAVCYTAYNHRFEPHFVRMRDVIASGRLGNIYSVRLFYGNGTARLVRESRWRDTGDGVLPDLGSHLLDTILFWFGRPSSPFHVQFARRHENAAYDHVALGNDGNPVINLEMMLLSWRNDFYAEIHGEKGSAHIRSLCKWGPTTFTYRIRKLPSGRPEEEVETLEQPDPTWALEYDHFRSLCRDPSGAGHGNIGNDIWINAELRRLGQEAAELAGRTAAQ